MGLISETNILLSLHMWDVAAESTIQPPTEEVTTEATCVTTNPYSLPELSFSSTGCLFLFLVMFAFSLSSLLPLGSVQSCWWCPILPHIQHDPLGPLCCFPPLFTPFLVKNALLPEFLSSFLSSFLSFSFLSSFSKRSMTESILGTS